MGGENRARPAADQQRWKLQTTGLAPPSPVGICLPWVAQATRLFRRATRPTARNAVSKGIMQDSRVNLFELRLLFGTYFCTNPKAYLRDLRMARAGAPSLFRIFTGRQTRSYLPGRTFVRFKPSMIQTPAPSST